MKTSNTQYLFDDSTDQWRRRDFSVWGANGGIFDELGGRTERIEQVGLCRWLGELGGICSPPRSTGTNADCSNFDGTVTAIVEYAFACGAVGMRWGFLRGVC